MHLALHETIDVRDQLIETVASAEKLRFFVGFCQDPQLQNMLQNHVQRMQQMTSVLLDELHFSGQNVNLPQLPSSAQQQPVAQQQQPTVQQMTWQNTQSMGTQAGMDHIAAADCLKDCKGLAIKATMAATEAASPHIRQLCHQICGEHLQMAEELYHYMEHRGWYHSPNLTQPVFQQVAQFMGQDLPQQQMAGSYYVS